MPVERPRVALPSAEKANIFIARHKDATAEARGTEAVRILLRDAKEYRERLQRATDGVEGSAVLREQIRDLETEIESLAAQIPGADKAVLAKIDVTELEEYRKLGKVADVTAALKVAGELSGKVVASDREKNAAIAAKALSYNAEALQTLARDLSLDFTFKKETINKKEVEIPYVKRSSDAKEVEPVKLSEFAKKNPIYLMALKSKGKSGSAGGGTGNDFVSMNDQSSSSNDDDDDADESEDADDENHSGTFFPVGGAENSGSGGKGGSTVDKFIKKRDESNAKRPNPLQRSSTSGAK